MNLAGRRESCAILAGVVAVMLLLAGLVRCEALAEAAAPTASLEHKVKAAYLLNFAKYVEWPGKAFASSNAPFAIGVLGEDPFGSILDRTVEGRTVNSRNVVIRRSKSGEELKQCQLVFIGASEKNRLTDVLAGFKGTFALTVGDLDQLFAAGGMIRFVIDEEVVKFEIDLDRTEAAGLKVSARMLSVAKGVRSKKRNLTR